MTAPYQQLFQDLLNKYKGLRALVLTDADGVSLIEVADPSALLPSCILDPSISSVVANSFSHIHKLNNGEFVSALVTVEIPVSAESTAVDNLEQVDTIEQTESKAQSTSNSEPIELSLLHFNFNPVFLVCICEPNSLSITQLREIRPEISKMIESIRQVVESVNPNDEM